MDTDNGFIDTDNGYLREKPIAYIPMYSWPKLP